MSKWLDDGRLASAQPADAAVGQLADNSLTKQVLTQPDALKRLRVQGILSDDKRQAVLDLWEETKAYYAQ